MSALIRGCVAAILVLGPSASYAGHCGSYRSYCYRPAYVAPLIAQPVYAAPPTTQYIYNVSYQQPVAQQGNTIYGLREAASIYGNVDLGAIYAQAMRHTDNAGAYASQALAGTQGLVSQLSADAAAINAQRLRVAEIQAKGFAAAQALQASGAAPTATIQRYTQGYSQGAIVQQPQQIQPQQIQPQPQQVGAVSLAAIYQQRCATCHGDQQTAAAKQTVAIPPFEQLTPDQKLVVRQRISTHDPQRRMPRGGALADEEMNVLLDYLCQPAQQPLQAQPLQAQPEPPAPQQQ